MRYVCLLSCAIQLFFFYFISRHFSLVFLGHLKDKHTAQVLLLLRQTQNGCTQAQLLANESLAKTRVSCPLECQLKVSFVALLCCCSAAYSPSRSRQSSIHPRIKCRNWIRLRNSWLLPRNSFWRSSSSSSTCFAGKWEKNRVPVPILLVTFLFFKLKLSFYSQIK